MSKQLVLSIDVGTKNLAYAIAEINNLPKKGTILDLKKDMKKPQCSLVNLQKDKTCTYRLKSGKNEGKLCEQTVRGKNKYCTRHMPKKPETKTENNCQFIITRGNNKGKICSKSVTNGRTYCKTHHVDGCIGLIKSGKNKGKVCGKKVLIGYRQCSNHCPKRVKRVKRSARPRLDLRKICKQMKVELDKDKLIDKVNLVLIEEQKPKNRSMVLMSRYIYAYFAMRLPLKCKVMYLTAKERMCTICGQFKELPFKSNEEYDDRKSNARLLAEHLFTNTWKDPETFKSFRKTDDVGDCIIQILWYYMRAYNISLSA